MASTEYASKMHVIAVVGPTGAGKSYFIAQLTGTKEITGNTLVSYTKDVQAYEVDVAGEQVVIIDTPGFGDTHRPDSAILALIAKWLAATYSNKILLSGLIYMHDISHTRMTSADVASINMFRKLCGKDFFKNVILVSNMWHKTLEEEGLARLAELKQKFWGVMVNQGARTTDFKDKDAKRIVLAIMENEPRAPKLAVELVDEKKDLLNTEAGKVADRYLTELRKKHEKDLASVQKQIEQAKEDHDRAMEDFLQVQAEEKEKILTEFEEERKRMKEVTERIEEDNRKLKEQLDSKGKGGISLLDLIEAFLPVRRQG